MFKPNKIIVAKSKVFVGGNYWRLNLFYNIKSFVDPELRNFIYVYLSSLRKSLHQIGLQVLEFIEIRLWLENDNR